MLLKLKFWILRKLNDNEPSIQEVTWALKQKVQFTKKIKKSMELYITHKSLDVVAWVQIVTRERVRQYIRKGVIQAWKQNED